MDPLASSSFQIDSNYGDMPNRKSFFARGKKIVPLPKSISDGDFFRYNKYLQERRDSRLDRIGYSSYDPPKKSYLSFYSGKIKRCWKRYVSKDKSVYSIFSKTMKIEETHSEREERFHIAKQKYIESIEKKESASVIRSRLDEYERLKCEFDIVETNGTNNYYNSGMLTKPQQITSFFKHIPPGGDIHMHIDGSISSLLSLAAAKGLFCTPYCGAEKISSSDKYTIKDADKFLFYEAGDPDGEINVSFMMQRESGLKIFRDHFNSLVKMKGVKDHVKFFNAFYTLESIAKFESLGTKILYLLSEVSENILYLEPGIWFDRESLPEEFKNGEEGFDFGKETFNFRQAFDHVFYNEHLSCRGVVALMNLLKKSGWVERHVERVRKTLNECHLQNLLDSCTNDIKQCESETAEFEVYKKEHIYHKKSEPNFSDIESWIEDFSRRAVYILNKKELKEIVDWHRKEIEKLSHLQNQNFHEGLEKKISKAINDLYTWQHTQQRIYLEKKLQFLRHKRQLLEDRKKKIEDLIKPKAENGKGYDPYNIFSGDNPTVIRFIIDNERRNPSLPDFFSDLFLSMVLERELDPIVGSGLAGEEFEDFAIQNFQPHMKIIRALKEHFPEAKLAPHAGELNRYMAEKSDLETHVRETVPIANRIGHAACILEDTQSEELMQIIRDSGITLELCLSSNEHVLGIENGGHPIHSLIKMGVPIVFCTDDQGVNGSSLAEELKIAAERYGPNAHRGSPASAVPGYRVAEDKIDDPDTTLEYWHIKKAIFNSIESSFLPGDSMFEGVNKPLKPLFAPSIVDGLPLSNGRGLQFLIRSCIVDGAWIADPWEMLTERQQKAIRSSIKSRLQFTLFKMFAEFEEKVHRNDYTLFR